ncbi:MAG TPA: hypothetical protein VGH69_01685 [Mycobacterium sp.]
MRAATPPRVMAAAALVAASVLAVTPISSRVTELPVVGMETRLVDSSIFNIPFNLLQDIVNIPYNEVQGLDTLANSFFFTGNWFVVSATNLWGVDPGDPSHFMSVTDLLLPFPELSGLGAPATDFDAGLGQQLWGLAAAELPVNAACDAASCIPAVPTSPITGITQIDSLIWLEQELTGGQQFPLINNWFQVPISDLQNGYTFDPSAPGSVDPSGPVVPGFGLDGTGVDNAMPWSGETFTLQPWVPVENFINSLMATPDPNGFEFPTFTEFAQALQAVYAGAIVDFDAITPGSPFCAGDCSILPDSLNYPALVQDISNIMPGNPIIDQWLADYANGAGVAGVDYNGPTEEQILNSIAILQQGFWDFGNPSPPAGTGPDFSQLTAFFYQLWTDLGLEPGQGVAASAIDPSAVLAGGWDPSQLSSDLSALAASLEPATLSADLSTLLESFATTLSADLATTLPSSLLGLF